jgi:hypothetical protein
VGRAAGLPDGIEQVEPEMLGIVLVAAHLHAGEPAVPVLTSGPGAQQRRFAAAGRRRDDRHLPRGHAVETSDEIVPGDQWQWLAGGAVVRWRLDVTHGGHRSSEPARPAVDNRHLTINRD